MVLLQGSTPRDKIYEELVIFMNSPEVAEHFVGWLVEEVGRLESIVVETGSSSNNVVEESGGVNESVKDVQMGGRVQGSRSFSKALQGALNSKPTNPSTTTTRKSSTFSEASTSPQRHSPQRRSPRARRVVANHFDDEASSSRRIIESDGKVQKIRLAVDFNREERRNYKKLPMRKTEDGDSDDVQKVIKVKCPYWPTCRSGDACTFVHPSETCKNFPNCQYGDSCTFVHPSIPCKFQEKCQNPLCNYQHRAPIASAASHHHLQQQSQTSTIQCRFYPRCVNTNCHYLHPVKVQCRYGVDCARPECPFEHAEGRKGAHLKSVVYAPCKYGKQCARADCPYQHMESSESSTTTTTPGVELNTPDNDNSIITDQPMQ